MDLAFWINFIYAIVTLIVMFALIDTKRIKELIPVGFLGVGLFFIAQEILFYLNLIKYHKAPYIVFGMPLSQLSWVFPYSILIASYMKIEWSKKLPIILLFTLINELQFYFAVIVGNITTANGYNIWVDTLATFAGISLAVWIGEGMFKERIYKNIKL